jgi:uncharacterized protein YbaA (DUF1428 family)
MSYVDGFVVAVPRDNKEAYAVEARKMWPVFRDHGALEMWECWGDDVPDGKVTSFPMAVKAAEDEVVVFSWILWPDRATRDKGNTAMMEDPRMKDLDMSAMPFDGKRMIYGGFAPLVHSTR